MCICEAGGHTFRIDIEWGKIHCRMLRVTGATRKEREQIEKDISAKAAELWRDGLPKTESAYQVLQGALEDYVLERATRYSVEEIAKRVDPHFCGLFVHVANARGERWVGDIG